MRIAWRVSWIFYPFSSPSLFTHHIISIIICLVPRPLEFRNGYSKGRVRTVLPCNVAKTICRLRPGGNIVDKVECFIKDAFSRITVFTRISAAVIITFFAPQVWRAYSRAALAYVALIYELDVTRKFFLGRYIFPNKRSIWTAALTRGWRLLTFLSQMRGLFE